MEVGLVSSVNIDHEMQQAYLDYAMSVIVARALPDARDGLKPVHRRILYAMYDMGLRSDSAYKKSARIVGEVLGKYHPHGDQAVYDAMARMAQNFSLRYLLVDGQGNFGSVDGDPPAAMRYTEARLTSPALQMLNDIGKETVDFGDNFDGTLTEPLVLPSAIPNMLVNGATGIAVGMATSIPPHNLSEVVDAMQYMLANWEKLDDLSVEDLMRFVQGPDFPTGGVIIHHEGGDGLVAAYSTGRGRVTVQARAHLEEMERGRNRIIVTELPYMTNKASLIERIAELAREEKIEGIVDLRDESDRQGMRIVIELGKTANPETALRDLYKYTPMQSTFSIIMLALVDGEPRLLSLKQAMKVFLEHRLEIVRRRSEFDLERARRRAHILEGLRIALKNLDEIIDLIRRAPDAETAHERLKKKYRLSDIQAQAILDMPLKRLAALERKKIEDEYKETIALIKELEALLKSPKKMRQVVGDELGQVKLAYGDRRRTHLVQLKEGETKAALLTSSDLLSQQTIWVGVTEDGVIWRTPDERQPRLSGSGAPAWLLQASPRHTLYLVCEGGEAAAIPVHALPESDSPAGGLPLARVSLLRENNRLAEVFAMLPRSREGAANEEESGYVVTASVQGLVKKSLLNELPGASANLFTLTRVNEGDRLGWLQLSSGSNEIMLVSASGMAIRFSEEEVRPMGLVSAGVMGMKLGAGEELRGMVILPERGELFLAATDGSAKRVLVEQFPRQGRHGQGVVAWKLPAGVSVAGMAAGASNTKVILHLKKLAAKSLRIDEAPLQSRTARGSAVIEVRAGDAVTRVTKVVESGERDSKGSSGSRGERSRSLKTASGKKMPVKTAPVKAQAAKTTAKTTAGKVLEKPSSGKALETKTQQSKAAESKPGVKSIAAKKVAKQSAASKAVKKTASAKAPAAKIRAATTGENSSTTKTTKQRNVSSKAVEKAPLAKTSAPKAAVKESQSGIVKALRSKTSTSKSAVSTASVKTRQVKPKTTVPSESKTTSTARSAAKTTSSQQSKAGKSTSRKTASKTPASRSPARASTKNTTSGKTTSNATAKKPAAKKNPPASST